MSTLQELTEKVMQARTETFEAKYVVTTSRDRWEEEHHTDITRAKECQEAQECAEEELRQATLQAYEETGNKAPGPGLGIRVIEALEYDEHAALLWAIQHEMALALDKKAFEKIAKADGKSMSFLTKTAKVTATIATDLATVLLESEAVPT